MALGRYSSTSASISSNTTTTLATPAATERIYVYWVGVDTTVAGTTSSADVGSSTGSQRIGFFSTVALGHAEAYPAQGHRDYPGFALPVGAALQVVTAGGAAATLTVSVIYEIKG
jgi:hypothetical protein